jgi:Flp pilus assembly protein TadG
MYRTRNLQSGQALVMVALSLFAMCGMMGLAVDLGWSFFVQKTARASADSAAMAAVKQALVSVESATGASVAGCSSAYCTTSGLIDCSSATGNLATGCQYANANGFANDSNGQIVRIEAGVGAPGCMTVTPPNCVPTAPGVAAFYWVHVIATQSIPQLFSALGGNRTGVVSADATAVLANTQMSGTIIMLSRANDGQSTGTAEVEGLFADGGGSVTAPSGIILAPNGPGGQGAGANCIGSTDVGCIHGAAVTTPFTMLRSNGKNNPTVDWTKSPSYLADTSVFQDPESGLGQPPLASNQASLPYIAVPNGQLTTAVCNPCASGNYYDTAVVNGKTVATGAPIVMGNNVTFNGGNFGNFLFFGGLQIGSGANVTLGPGQYVLAGVLNKSSSGGVNQAKCSSYCSGDPTTTNELDTSGTGGTNNGGNDLGLGAGGGGTVTGGTSATGDAGRLFIITNSSYGGDATMAAVVSHMASLYSSALAGVTNWSSSPTNPTFGYGPAAIEAGNNGNVTLYGLNPDSNNVPAALQPFGPLVVWQDQQDTNIVYDSHGNVVTSSICGGSGIESPCINKNQFSCNGGNSCDQLNVGTTQNNPKTTLKLSGTVYQPRGSLLNITGNASSPTIYIGGSIDIANGATLTLTNAPFGSTKLGPALVH